MWSPFMCVCAIKLKHLHWRKVNKVDTILNDYKPSEVLERYITLSSLGFDKEGFPVNYCEYGNLDIKGLAKCVRKSEILVYLIRHIENDVQIVKKQSEKLGKVIDKWTYIFNYENFSFANATDKTAVDVLINLIKMYDSNHPERLKSAYLINASFYFTICWSIIKPFLSPATSEKIKIFGRALHYALKNSGKQSYILPTCMRMSFLGKALVIPQVRLDTTTDLFQNNCEEFRYCWNQKMRNKSFRAPVCGGEPLSTATTYLQNYYRWRYSALLQ
ncbi:SEC14-like protein 2 [Trichonephila clavipes]|nr:SEC14-like protein 2 [Trichonephila clavipes]